MSTAVGRLRCVVVDDHAVFRIGLRVALEARGHRVVRELASGSELLRSIESLGDVDLLVLDARMPGVDGFGAAEEVRAILPRLPIVMVTTFDDEATRIRAIECGVVAVMSKDETAEGLVQALERAAQAHVAPIKGAPTFGLTLRELEVLERMVAGASNRVIAEQMRISPDTVKEHVSQILLKLGVAERVSAVRVALQHRLVS